MATVLISKGEASTIYKQNFEKIYRSFYYKTLKKEVAEDLTEETFMNFVE